MRKLSSAVYFLVAAALPGCGGGSGPALSAGPIITQTELTEVSGGPSGSLPLQPGQSYSATFRVQTCRYQTYTSEAAHGQYRSLGCDAGHVPAALTATVEPRRSDGQPCAATAQITQPGTVLVTKTGPGDPDLGGGPNGFYCLVDVADPLLGQDAVLYV